MEALPDHDVAADVNRKRKMSPGPLAGGLKRGSKLTRPNPQPAVLAAGSSFSAATGSVANGRTPPGFAAGAAVTPQDAGIQTSDRFIDHQKAMLHADVAPTPHCPVGNIPPTPAFVNRNGFGHTPDSFAGTPCEDFGAAGNPTPQGDAGAAAGEDGTPASAKAHAPTPSPVPRAAPLNLRNFANWDVSSRYTLVRLLGKGSYGQVSRIAGHFPDFFFRKD